MNTITIHDKTIGKGQYAKVMLPMPELTDWTPLYMPVHVFNGKEHGPVLAVTAAVHGDEVNGIEIVRQLLKKINPKRLAGTLIAVPVVNIYGFLYQDRYLMDRRDLNRSFPGSQKGSLAARLADLIKREIISNATHMVDLHAGSHHRTNLPQIRTNLDSNVSFEMAKSFNAPVMLHATLRDGSMRQFASDSEIPFLLFEAGESLRLDLFSIRTGLHGILRVMQYLEMISPKKRYGKQISPIAARTSYWIRAQRSGILRTIKKLGKTIHKGEAIAFIGNPTSTEEYPLYSPISGVIIGQSNLPMVHEGAALFHVASFEELGLVEQQIEHLQEAYREEQDTF